uniref:Arsenite methyltransferase n=1 Tax=Leptobrachium leishanense TaxID=445787 RepID=A0A8C5R029_9ANUR
LTSKDLKTNACVTPAKPVPKFIREALNEVHEEVSSRYYGCGLVVPECLENCSILDLGSGSGRDCYMLSKLVGEKGSITGIDMTEEQVWGVKYIDYHTKKFGYQRPNVEFSQGYIENLNARGPQSAEASFVFVRCIVADGGEMYFSDVYANHAITEDLKKNKVLWGECISGALYWKELFQIAEEIGFSSPRLVSSSFITVDNKELEELLGDYKFVSATFRLFKVPKNKVQEKSLVIYDGGITGFKDEIQFDVNFTFKVQNARASCELYQAVCQILVNCQQVRCLFDGSEIPHREAMVNPFRDAEQQRNVSEMPCCLVVSFDRFILANPIGFNVKNIPVLIQYLINCLLF